MGSARPAARSARAANADHPPSDWNVYVLHFSDGDNWGEDNRQCIALLRDQQRVVAHALRSGCRRATGDQAYSELSADGRVSRR